MFPAKIIKYRHTSRLRDALIESNWWNWDIEQLKLITKHFQSKTPMSYERFIEIERVANSKYRPEASTNLPNVIPQKSL